MKRFLALIIITVLIVSCDDNKIEIARQYAQENINRSGRFNVEIKEFKKIDGEAYVNKNTGKDMYALEFTGSVKSNQEGFVIVEKDGMVRNFNFFMYNIKNEIQHSFIKIYDIKHINIGEEFGIHSRVIMNKTELGWSPLALRWDIY